MPLSVGSLSLAVGCAVGDEVECRAKQECPPGDSCPPGLYPVDGIARNPT
jgi:hypothetical protein